jgi:hypothetical protein
MTFDRYDAIGLCVGLVVAMGICNIFAIIWPWTLIVYFFVGMITNLLVAVPLRRSNIL